MHYREVVPGPGLRPFVRCLWHMRADGAGATPQVERIVPDGCAEIVLNRADRFRRLDDDGSSHVQARVLLVGQIRRAIAIVPSGSIDLLGIRFEPGGLFALLGIPMHELADRDFALEQAESGLAALLARALERDDPCARIAAVEEVLRERYADRGLSGALGAGLVGGAVRLVERGLPSAEAVARELGVNRRGLERLFRLEVGLSPKLYLRMRRLQAVLARLDGDRPAPGWAALAVDHGYADQSHLIRDFRLLVGTTPERYLAERTPMAGQFEAPPS